MLKVPANVVSAQNKVDFSSSTFHQKLLDHLFDGVYFVDTERRIQYWNRGAERLTGYSRDEAVGKRCYDNFLCHLDEKGRPLCNDACPLVKSMDAGETQEAEISLRNKAGERVLVSVRVAPMSDEAGEIIGAMEVFAEVTARTRIQSRVRQLEKLAFIDQLTNLQNRRFIEVRLRQILELLREFNRDAGILMIDIDLFKRVNDSYGHDVGDEALRLVAHTLQRSVRAVDIVGRWGGEEFVVIASDVDADKLHLIAERCRNSVAEAVLSANQERYQVTVSIGATLMSEKDSVASVIKRADELLYKSKAAGRKRTTVG
jgi:diguanylate cyclase (GGDEF)-like protein/PAS domain S-box-containing protein